MSQKKNKKHAKSSGGGLRRFALCVLLVCAALVAALSFSERKHWPENLRNEDAVIALYKTRDEIIERIWSRGDTTIDVLPAQTKAKEPINIRPAKTKPEQGYAPKDRAKLDALIEKEGEIK